MNLFSVIIAGGREFDNYRMLEQTASQAIRDWVDEIYKGAPEPKIDIISGAARGADKLGEQFAREYGMTVNRMPANWELYGKSAGYRRNEEMTKHANALIAYWDGESRGTKHMIDIATRRELLVRIIRYDCLEGDYGDYIF